MFYEFWFEGESGMETDMIDANNYNQACRMLKVRHPDDHGADGYVIDPMGTERPILW